MFAGAIHIKPLAGCQIDPERFVGAAVRCYIPARDEEEAMDMLLDSLQENFMQLTKIDFLVDDDEVEWENPESEEAALLIREAKANERVEFGEFYAWVDEEEEKED
ncbi:hypothetical protein [Luteolibacter sp. Populi]|uniref:hypothetical protein n=1 Tax=Luteolibacter sp. Populi TaxID=3230487 RepID=UPI003464FB8F